MNFDEQNKVIINSMNAVEARAFIKFLLSEIARHKMDIDNARDLIYDVCRLYRIADILGDE